ncbi:MAG TPA: trimethylamine methyltransferase family protein, partial [Armatimonadota bacterium]|nr:trimethylamine methyltransferase family protein [Armatimonadota bacterium]
MKPLPLIRYLSDSEVALIHDRSLTLCAEMGMKITYAALLGRLAKAGAIVADEVVRFPREMVEAAIEAAPKELALHGRCGQVQMAGRGHRDKFPTLHANAVRMLDHGAGQLRDSTFEDLTSLLKLADSLGTVARVATPVYPWDVPEPLRELRCVEAMLTHTTKNLIEAPQTVFELDLWCEALELFAYAPLPEKALVAITISP